MYKSINEMASFIKNYAEKLPKPKFIVRSKSGLHSFSVERPRVNESAENSFNLPSLSEDDSLRAMCSGVESLRLPPLFSPSGNIVCIVGESTTVQGKPTASSNIRLFSTNKIQLIGVIPCYDAQHIEFSPQGNFILTWSRPQKGTILQFLLSLFYCRIIITRDRRCHSFR